MIETVVKLWAFASLAVVAVYSIGCAPSSATAPEASLELGLRGAGASPAHIAIIGASVANSVHCDWHSSAMTNQQREDSLRFC